MATSKAIHPMKCRHDATGKHEFDCCKKSKKPNAEMEKKVQKALLNMGGGQFLQDKDEPDEFLIKR